MNITGYFPRLLLVAGLSVAATQAQALGRPTSGAQYAQLLTFATAPGIGGASFTVDDDLGDVDYDIYKLPLQHEFDVDGWDWKLILRGTLSYMKASQDQRWLPGDRSEVIDSEWKSYGGSIGAGVRVPLGNGFSFIPALGFGLASLKNDADFKGTLTKERIKPIADGTQYNWDMNATIFTGALGLSYIGDIGNDFDLDANAYYTYSYVSSFDSSTDFQDIGDSTNTLTFRADIGHPLGFSIAGYPMDGVLHLANTTFVGSNSDVLGFSYFNEAGFSLRTNPQKLASQLHLPFSVSSLSLGVNAIFGDDISGWSMLFGYKF
jgi:hypothetical protein